MDLTLYSSQISSLISSLIIFLCAFVAFFKLAIQNRLLKDNEKLGEIPNANKEGGDAQ